MTEIRSVYPKQKELFRTLCISKQIYKSLKIIFRCRIRIDSLKKTLKTGNLLQMIL